MNYMMTFPNLVCERPVQVTHSPTTESPLIEPNDEKLKELRTLMERM